MGNNGASKQSTGKIFTTERLIINFKEIPAERNENDEIVVKEPIRKFIVGYFNGENENEKVKDKEDKDSKEDEEEKNVDKAKWEALAKGDSVQAVDRASAVKNLYSQWQLSETERMTVYNPLMKYSPVKVTRINDVVYINVWVKKNTDYMKPMESLYSDTTKTYLPRSKKIWDLVIEAFKFWEGRYKAKENVNSFDYDDEIHVEALVHDNLVTPQKHVTIVVHDSAPQTQKKGERTYATPLNSADKELNFYTKWSTHMKGFIINAYTWYEFENETTGKVKPAPFDDTDFKIVMAHEVGHLLGLAEAYELTLEDKENNKKYSYSVDDSSKEVPPEDIMRADNLSTRIVTPNDIEMILNCWMKEGHLQLFYDIDIFDEGVKEDKNKKFKQSKVILTAPDKEKITENQTQPKPE